MNYQVTIEPVAKLDDNGQIITNGDVEIIQRVDFVDAAKIFNEVAKARGVYMPPISPVEVHPLIDAGESFVIGGVGYDWKISLERCKPSS